MSRKKQFSVRLRPDQERQIQLMLDRDPELDFSKIARKAIDEYLARRKKRVANRNESIYVHRQ